ncbi:hypothetical protein NTJ12_002468 [Flavobacterium psychrophilum]|nr:hypothetical protein [Flavobacterium psychrophilum]
MLLLLLLIFELGLYTYKYYSISKKEADSKTSNYNKTAIIHNGVMYAIGGIGDYPILRISNNNGKSWHTVNVRGLLWDAFPTESYFYGIKAVANTIWFHEIETCIECDGANRLHNIFYSHDNGKTWCKINWIRYIRQGTFVDFDNDKDGYMSIPISDIDYEKYYTTDGGANWIEK